MIVTRPDPLRKNIVTELRAIVDVRIALPHVTVQRKDLRSTGPKRVSHAETNFRSYLRGQYRCLRIANLRRWTRTQRQLIRQHTREIPGNVVLITEAPWLRRIVHRAGVVAVDSDRISAHQCKLTELCAVREFDGGRPATPCIGRP